MGVIGRLVACLLRGIGRPLCCAIATFDSLFILARSMENILKSLCVVAMSDHVDIDVGIRISRFLLGAVRILGIILSLLLIR